MHILNRIITFIKQWLPKTLYGRSLIIVIAPVILAQGITTYVFYDRHWSKVTQIIANDLAGEISACIELFVSPNFSHFNDYFIERYAASHFGFNVHFKQGDLVAVPSKDVVLNWREAILTPILQRHINLPFYLTVNDQFIEISIATSRGTIYFLTATKQLFTRTTPLLIWWALLTPLLFLVIAVIFLRNQVKPLRQLSAIVDEFGKGRDVKALRPSGATELRLLGRAFNAMKERIHRQMTQRAEMLAGVSHDLRTPLTRMELSLAMIPDDPVVRELQDDVREMARMIDDYLAFARGDQGEDTTSFDVIYSIKDITRHYPSSRINCENLPLSLMIVARPHSLRRCLTNIISNSMRYASTAYININDQPKMIWITIEDDGIGIPVSSREEVFRPFVRLETSRNPETGGSGLGLSVARTIARNHGGDIHLGSSENYGGLKVTISLPK